MAWSVPIRPKQTSDLRLALWAERRRIVGARIRELRLEKGLTQESLALETGLSRNMVIGIEWGRRSVAYERLWDLADVLGVGVEDIIVRPQSDPMHAQYRGGRHPS